MLRLSKKVEYALIAVHYIASNRGRFISAKEIAEYYNISFEFLSKALQILMRKKFIISQQGVNGGYVLTKDPAYTFITEIIEAVEGKQTLVECCGEKNDETCTLHNRCPIKNPMSIVQRKIDEALNTMSIADMVMESQTVMITTLTPSKPVHN